MDINEIIYLTYQLVNEHIINYNITVEDYWFEKILISFFKNNLNIEINNFIYFLAKDIDFYLYKKYSSDIKNINYSCKISKKFKIRTLTKRIIYAIRRRNIEIIKNI
jgi:hypothetical protein